MINRLKIEINIQDEREQKVNQMQIFNSIIKNLSIFAIKICLKVLKKV